MSLINIEYGSLASSDTMNKNFMYLENKIAENTESLMTSISSILSNIATINSRINDITEDMTDSDSSLEAKLEDYKTKTKALVNNVSMVPDWTSCVAVQIKNDDTEPYVVLTNGYYLVIPVSSSKGEIIINNSPFEFKKRGSSYDNASQLMVIPVSKDDEVLITAEMETVYFLPALSVSVEGF